MVFVEVKEVVRIIKLMGFVITITYTIIIVIAMAIAIIHN